MKNIYSIILLLTISFTTYSFSQAFSPFNDQVMNPTPTGSRAAMSWPGSPYDWDAIYQSAYPQNWFTDPNPHIASDARTDELQYLMSYYEMRYNLSGILHMYKKTRDTSYLREYVNQANLAFDPSRFQDGSNGCADGFMGWGMKRPSQVTSPNDRFPIYLNQELLPNIWYHMKVRVQDTLVGGVNKTRIRVWVGSQMFEFRYDLGIYPNGGSTPGPGTIALLSGWSRNRYKNLTILDLQSGQQFYDLNASINTFGQDWSKTKNSDQTTYPADTGEWLIDTSSHEVTCDATTNTPGPFYYPYNPNDPQNHNKFPNGTGDGKYAGLVLVKAGATQLLNYQVEFDIKLEKRNNLSSEAGLGIRWNADPGNSITDGARTFDNSRNKYFKHFAKFIEVKLRPNVLSVMTYANPSSNWAFGSPFYAGSGGTFNGDVQLYSERLEYDSRACWPLLDFVETVYKDSLTSFYSAADNYLIKVQNNIIAKWYTKESKNSGNLVYGGADAVDYGGWERSPLGVQMCNFHDGKLYSILNRISHNSYNHWLQVTQSNPSAYLPSVSELPAYYDSTSRKMARRWLQDKWNENDYYQWFWFRDFSGEFVAGSPDMLHQAEAISFLVEEYEAGVISRPEIDSLARTFTKKMWNQLSGQSASISTDISGAYLSGDPPIDVRWNGDYFLSLCKVDFKVWEIFNDWITKYHSEYQSLGWLGYYYYHFYQASLVYYVKYGVPKTFQVSSITGNGTSVSLAWSNPSDYPTSAERPAGTGLRYYNIYRRTYGQSWPSTPYTQLSSSSHTFTDNNLDPTQIYQYKIRSQDWTARYRNESDDSNILSVHMGEVVDLLENGSSLAGTITLNNSLVLPAGNTVSINATANVNPPTGQSRNFWVYGITQVSGGSFQINSGVTLRPLYPAKFYLTNYSDLTIYGRISALGTPSQRIMFTSLEANPTPGDWNGIICSGGGPDTLTYCDIKYGADGLWLQNTAANSYLQNDTIQNSSSMGYGVRVYSTGTGNSALRMYKCGIKSNDGKGLLVSNAKVSVSYSSIENNGLQSISTGIYLTGGARVFFDSSRIQNNNGSGLKIYGLGTRALLTPDSLKTGYNTITQHGVSEIWLLNSGSAFLGGGYAPGAYGGLNNVYNNFNYSCRLINNATSNLVSAKWTYWGSTGNRFCGPVDSSSPQGSPVNTPAIMKYHDPADEPMAAVYPSATLGDWLIQLKSDIANNNENAFDALHHLANFSGPGGGYQSVLGMSWENFLSTVITKSSLPSVRSLATALLVESSLGKGEFANAITSADDLLAKRVDDDLGFFLQTRKIYAEVGRGNISSAKDVLSEIQATASLSDTDAVKAMTEYVALASKSAKDNGASGYLVKNAISQDQIPNRYILSQNFPNPFNPTTSFRYEIAIAGHVNLKIYDVLGREIALIVNEEKDPGEYIVLWDAGNYSSGVYFFKLQAGAFTDVKKMLLVR